MTAPAAAAPIPALRPAALGCDLQVPRRHLRALLRGDGYYELRPLRRDGERMQPGASYWITVADDHPADLDRALIWAAEQARAGYELFVSPNPRFHRGGKSKADVAVLMSCYADLDLHGARLDEATAALLALPAPPSLIVRSGQGLHPYWLIAPTTDRDRWTQVQAGILRVLTPWAADPAVAGDTARVLRLAGPPNGKAGGPYPTGLVAQSGRVYALAELAAAFVPPPVVAASSRPPTDDLAGLRRWAARGVEAGQRDDAAWWLACRLAASPAAWTEKRAVMLTFCDACRPAFDSAVGLEKLDRAARQIAPDPTRAHTPPPVAVELLDPPGAVLPDWVLTALRDDNNALLAENAALRDALAAATAPVDVQLAAVTAERDALRDRLGKIEAILWNPHLATADRVGLLCYQDIAEQLPRGERQEVSQQAYAARYGVPTSTMSRWFDRWQEMDLSTHWAGPDKAYPVRDGQGRPRVNTRTGQPLYEKRTYLTCTIAPFEAIATLASPNMRATGTKYGGNHNRICPNPACDGVADDQEDFHGKRCKKCGTVYQVGDRTTAYAPVPVAEWQATGVPAPAALNSHNGNGAKRSTPTMERPRPLPLAATGDAVREAAKANPQIAGYVDSVRRRRHAITQDLAVEEYTATHLSPTVGLRDRDPWCPVHRRPVELVADAARFDCGCTVATVPPGTARAGP